MSANVHRLPHTSTQPYFYRDAPGCDRRLVRTSTERSRDIELRCEQVSASEGTGSDSLRKIVGASAALQHALEQIMIVAPTNATVLIQGETGTGKELVAHALHHLSPRAAGPFVRFNCAAIPLGLLESELFGHEKGAFTGAVSRKIGRFELANQGTLFLDEIGDIPLELQAKLLRVLQEQEFERLGSNQTQRVNVRLITATHRDLKEMVTQREFRSDLYFRLNIFPVILPPLRERREDIPLLIRHFAEDCVRRLKRNVKRIPAATVAALVQYNWPGNIRELQNFIERSVILSLGTDLNAPLGELRTSSAPVHAKTLAEAEYQHILRALKETGWVVGGPNGAASKLGLKRTTLIGKMRKMQISRSIDAIQPELSSGTGRYAITEFTQRSNL